IPGPRRWLRVCRRGVGFDIDDAIGFREGQRSQHSGVNDAEHGCSYADTERQGEDCYYCEPGRLAQLPQRETEILAEREHKSSPARFAGVIDEGRSDLVPANRSS